MGRKQACVVARETIAYLCSQTSSLSTIDIRPSTQRLTALAARQAMPPLTGLPTVIYRIASLRLGSFFTFTNPLG